MRWLLFLFCMGSCGQVLGMDPKELAEYDTLSSIDARIDFLTRHRDCITAANPACLQRALHLRNVLEAHQQQYPATQLEVDRFMWLIRQYQLKQERRGISGLRLMQAEVFFEQEGARIARDRYNGFK